MYLLLKFKIKKIRRKNQKQNGGKKIKISGNFQHDKITKSWKKINEKLRKKRWEKFIQNKKTCRKFPILKKKNHFHNNNNSKF